LVPGERADSHRHSILLAPRRSFPLTPLLYRLLALHAIILMIDGHRSYAEAPAGHWVENRHAVPMTGHVVQSFIPVILVSDIADDVLRRGTWAVAVLLFTVLGISAGHELIE
jgi:putative membrane protein